MPGHDLLVVPSDLNAGVGCRRDRAWVGLRRIDRVGLKAMRDLRKTIRIQIRFDEHVVVATRCASVDGKQDRREQRPGRCRERRDACRVALEDVVVGIPTHDIGIARARRVERDE